MSNYPPRRYRGLTDPQLSMPRLAGSSILTDFNYASPNDFGDGIAKGSDSDKSGMSGEQIAGLANNILPFVTNIVNSFRKPAKAKNPHLIDNVRLGRINYGTARQGINESTRTMVRNAALNLDENSAAAVSGAYQAKGNAALAEVDQAESNANQQIINQERQLNSSVQAANASKLDQKDLLDVERQIAIQRESSANLSNSVDKFLEMQNQRGGKKLDQEKFKIMMEAFNTYGVGERAKKSLEEKGIKFAKGGSMDPVPKGDPMRIPQGRTKMAVLNTTGNWADNYTFNIQDMMIGDTRLVPYIRSNGTRGALDRGELYRALQSHGFKDTGDVFVSELANRYEATRYMNDQPTTLLLPPDTKKPVKKHALGGELDPVVPALPGAKKLGTIKRTASEQDMSSLVGHSDLVNALIGSANPNPVGTKQGRALLQRMGPGAQNLLDDVTLFNKSENFSGMKGDDRIRAYYSSPGGDAATLAFKQKLRGLNASGGSYVNSPDLDVQATQLLAKRSFRKGGRMKVHLTY